MPEYIIETDSNLNWKHEPPATSAELHAILTASLSSMPHMQQDSSLASCVLVYVSSLLHKTSTPCRMAMTPTAQLQMLWKALYLFD